MGKKGAKAKPEDVDLGYQGPTDPAVASRRRSFPLYALVTVTVVDFVSSIVRITRIV